MQGKYDVVAVVLFVEEHSLEIISQTGRKNYVREIVITDQSNEQPVTVSVWNDLSEHDCDRLNNWAAKFQVVGFTSLRTVTRRGFALSSWMSTRIIHDPIGDRANVLKEWTKTTLSTLMDRQARVLKVRYPTNDKVLLTIAKLQLRKAAMLFKIERFWIRITIPNGELDKVNAYTGCSICSKRTTVPVGTPFYCNVCRKSDCVSADRVTFKFEATDDTGTMSFTTFNDDTEKLFGKSASEICSIKNTEDYEAFQYIRYLLQTKPVLVKVGPTLTLSRNNVLQWQFKGLEIEQTTPDTNEKASLQKMDDELHELLDASEEIKYSHNNELAVFYSESESLSQAAEIANSPKKKLRRKLVCVMMMAVVNTPVKSQRKKETSLGSSSAAIPDQP
uniref:Replication factor A C-terminal domain-containing protein n=1 Tax=Chenopodium quinoa TaxID=63459 RepID=A0A803MY44_CHEQI